MKCPKCQHENVVEAKFCEECTGPLPRACANCGCEVSGTAKFCSECGCPLPPAADNTRFGSPKSYTPQHLAEKILTSRSALEGERKQVTVLFADIRGSMELLADRDPEAAEKLLLDPVVERMIEAVHRYEGTVHRVLGDGIMALFGAPLAVEDHAVRACYAGLRMQETVTRFADEIEPSVGVGPAIRVGINSGEIVIRAIGSDLNMDFTVIGRTAHLASRMEQMAEHGSVLIAADTQRLVEDYIAVAPLGPTPVRGLAEPIEIYRVTGAGAARTRLQAAAGRGLTRFVGRDLELDRLRDAQLLAGQGRSQIVAIVGEAGVGKSRLVHEFLHSPQTADWLVLESSSVSYGRTTPYLPVIELLRGYIEIDDHDSTPSIRGKVTARISALDPLLRDAVPPVLDLLDALDDGDPFRSLDVIQHRQRTYRAVIELLLAETRRQPVIAVVEDLHFNDTLTLGLLNELIAAAENARLLLLVSYRRQYRDDWRNRPNFHQLNLDPFGGESFVEFLEALLGSGASLPPLRSFLTERASGNPFFAEEIVRSLVDIGALEGVRAGYRLVRPLNGTAVPHTVQAVLAARIDALPAAEKRVLEEAAVIGHDVPFALLSAICGLPDQRLRSLLDSLQGSEFLYAKQLFPDLQYTFRHALTHDVAYGGVLHERRRAVHANVVEAIERLYGDRLGEHVERLAHHAVESGLREKAVHYLRQAGAKAAARAAVAEARALFEHALGILVSLPEGRATLEQGFEVRLELRPVLRQLGEARQMIDCLREAETLAHRLEDERRAGQVCALMTTVLSTLDELDEAVAAGTRALEIAERFGDVRLRILTTSCLEQAYFYRGDYERVIRLAAENLAAMPAEWGNEYFGLTLTAPVASRVWLIMSLAELGRFEEAARCEAEASRLASPTQHAFTIAWAHFAATMLHMIKGDWSQARARTDLWIEMVRTGNVAVLLAWAVAFSARALAEIGEAGEALRRVQEGEQLLGRQAAQGIVGHRGWAYHAVGRACLLLGRINEARCFADRAVESARYQPAFAAHALHLLGEVAGHPDQFDAESGAFHYRQALTLAERYGMRPLTAHCHLGLGKLYRRIGETEHARENLTIAMTMYREMEMNFWLKQGRRYDEI